MMMIKSENISDDEDFWPTAKDQAGADPGNTSRKLLLLVEEEMQEDEIMEITQHPAVLEPLPKRKSALHLTQKVWRCKHCNYSSILASSVRNHLKTHGRNLEHKCTLCDFSSSQKYCVVSHLKNQHSLPLHPSSQVDRAEDLLPVKVFEELKQPMNVERPMTDVTSVLDNHQSKVNRAEDRPMNVTEKLDPSGNMDVERSMTDITSVVDKQQSKVDRAEDLPVNVTEKLDPSGNDVERPMADATSVLDKQQSKELTHQEVADNPSDSRNDTADVIYCRRCFFWSRRPEHFHQHFYQCWNGFSCSACDFSGTRLNVLHHIRERNKDGDNAHSTSVVCHTSNLTIPDNEYADFRQNICVTPLQYGFSNSETRVAPDQIGGDSVWDPMAMLSFTQNEGNLEEGALNYEKEKDGLKIQIEDSFQQLGELEKKLETKKVEYNEIEKRVLELKDNASNIDQKKTMMLYENQQVVTRKLNDASALKHQAEMAHSKQNEEVKILMVQQVKSNYSKEAAKNLEEAEKELERLKKEVEQKRNNWSAIFTECGEVSCQLSEAEKTRADNIDFLFFLNNSLGELNSTIGNLKGQIVTLKSSIQKLLQSRHDLNEAQLKNLSNEFRRKEAEWIQGLHSQICN